MSQNFNPESHPDKFPDIMGTVNRLSRTAQQLKNHALSDSRKAETTCTFQDILDAKERLDRIPVETFEGFAVVENPILPPMGVAIMVGSEYMRKLKLQEINS